MSYHKKLLADPNTNLDRLFEIITSQQEDEFDQLINIFRKERITSFLEIGSRYGGSLWRIAQTMPKGSLIVSVDSGSGPGSGKPFAMKSLNDCINALIGDGYDAHLIIGDSQHKDTIDQVAKFAPFDAIFIDGDHSFLGVQKDWENYGPMGGVIAFHDVCSTSPIVEVPKLWSAIQDKYKSMTIKEDTHDMGIGVLWRS